MGMVRKGGKVSIDCGDMDRLQDLYFREERAPLIIIAFFCPLSFVVERWMSRSFLLLVV
jgi:hypothetical protein